MAAKRKLTEEPTLRDVLDWLSKLQNKIEQLEQQNNELQQLLRVVAQPILWSSLRPIFSKPKQLWAYELSDGERSTRDIGKIVGVDQKTISTWWRTWAEEYAIVEKSGVRGQFKHRFNLYELLMLYSNDDSTSS